MSTIFSLIPVMVVPFAWDDGISLMRAERMAVARLLELFARSSDDSRRGLRPCRSWQINGGMKTIAKLAQLIMRHAPETGMCGTPMRRLSLIRTNEPSAPVPAVSKPRFV
ncbi:hypothetical protein [Aureimonas altamirensis]|uniref:hypothetical protein n=1 Tax=Aureimonas altamirensis TaxID=370622 RepID=UPI003017F11C